MAAEMHAQQERVSKLDIEDFVQNATWRELLVELVESKKLDPWDIDISRMLDAYIDVIRKMKVLDLRVPANVILAASILLRMKSESLASLYEETEEAPEPEEEAAGRPAVEVPSLITRLRVQPSKKITLQELMEALDGAMKAEDRRTTYMREMQMPISITVSEDIDSRTDAVYGIIMKGKDRLGMATFSGLAANFATMEERLLNLFVPLLFLAQNELITLQQEEFFGEIIIRLIDQHGKGTAKA
jgi:segregation and condensation protein A